MLEYYQVYSNDHPVFTFTYFTARSNLVPYAFVWAKGKQMDFSESIVVYDAKVGRCSLLNELMNLFDYQMPMSFIDFGPRSLRFTFSNFFFLKTAWPIEAKIQVESPGDVGVKVYCPYLYFGSAIMLVTYFVNFR